MTIDELKAENLTTPPQTYATGEAELEAIAKAIEQGDIAIDKLGLSVRRADYLNTFLEGQLRSIEQDLKALAPHANQPNEKKPPMF